MPNIYEFGRVDAFQEGKDSYIELGSRIAVPGVACDICGSTWAAGVEGIPDELPDNHPLWTLKRWPVSPQELNKLRAEFREALNLSDAIDLKPGTEVGLMKLASRTAHPHDFEWPVLFEIIIRDDVLEFLKSNGITGWSAYPLELLLKGKKLQGVAPPQVYQLFVDGRGGKPITTPELQLKESCSTCGYERYYSPLVEDFSLDESQWDGSDIFRFDFPWNGYTFITEKFAQALRNSTYYRYQLRTVEEFLAESNRHRTDAK